MIKLDVRSLGFSIDHTAILDDVSLTIEQGTFVGLVGPNGCGKSTLLKNIYRVYKPDGGEILLNEEPVRSIDNKRFAREMSVMVQENNVEFDLTVLDMVMLGRYAHKKLLVDSSKKDREIAVHYISEVGMAGYEERSFLSLSGGEKQRVLLARALAQEAEFIVLDEPTNHLDIKYQFQIMTILKKQNITVFASVHDLNIASLYCDKIIVMKKGRIVSIGTPEQVLTRECLHDLYGIDTDISISPATGRVQITFLPPDDV